MQVLAALYSNELPYLSDRNIDTSKSLYWYSQALEKMPNDHERKKYVISGLENLHSVKADKVLADYQNKIVERRKHAAIEKQKQERKRQIAALEQKQQDIRDAEYRREREEQRAESLSALLSFAGAVAEYKGVKEQKRDSAREAQRQLDQQEAAREQAQLQKEIDALKREQQQQAQLQKINAAAQRKQSAEQQASLLSTQQAQRDAAEKQRQLRQKQREAQAKQQRLQQQRQQQLAQASQQQAQTSTATQQVSYRNCIGGAESNPRVRNKNVGSEAYIKNSCDGPIDFVLCARDNTDGLNIYSPRASGWRVFIILCQPSSAHRLMCLSKRSGKWIIS